MEATFFTTYTRNMKESHCGYSRRLLCYKCFLQVLLSICSPITSKRSTFKNIARNRLVHTSSLWDDDIQRFDPQHLTDGYRGGDNPYCTSTKKEGHAWFKVDLQNVYQIDHVLVYTGWYINEPCNAYQIRVGHTSAWDDMTSCGEGSQAQNEIIVCKDCLIGRYVQLQLISSDALCYFITCEVEVIGTAI